MYAELPLGPGIEYPARVRTDLASKGPPKVRKTTGGPPDHLPPPPLPLNWGPEGPEGIYKGPGRPARGAGRHSVIVSSG